MTRPTQGSEYERGHLHAAFCRRAPSFVTPTGPYREKFGDQLVLEGGTKYSMVREKHEDYVHLVRRIMIGYNTCYLG